MKRILCVVLGLMLISCSFAANKRFDTMIIFGDSMSDTGNLYRFMWNKFPVSPPYYEGRFSDGPLWNEQLYSSYYPEHYTQGFQNYAVGGAGAVLSYKQNLPFTLSVELGDYLYWNTYGKKDTSLYIIWIGANNYINGPTNVESITSDVVNAIGSAVERLISDGGDKFLIPNLPDMGRMPQSVDLHIQGLVTELATAHNRKLEAKVQDLQKKYPDVTIVHLDMFNHFNEAIEHPQDYGFTNVTEPCYMGSYSGWLQKPSDESILTYLKEQDSQFDTARWNMINENPMLKEAALASYMYHLLPEKYQSEPLNCTEYAFWDHVHPTTRVHYYIAQRAREALENAGLQAFVPE